MREKPENIANPVVTRRLSEGIVKPRYIGEEALGVYRLRPQKTAWGWEQGKPILDRLPSWSQAYKKGYDQDQAYVYYDPTSQRSFLGPGSCEVHTDVKDTGTLIMESGAITWYGGTLDVDRVDIHLGKLGQFGDGIQNGKFSVGYELSIGYPEDSRVFPGYSFIEVVDERLAEAKIRYASSQDSVNYETANAVSGSELEGEWRPRYLGNVDDFQPGASYFLDFSAPVHVDHFTLKAGDEYESTAICTAYYSDDNITWIRVRDEPCVDNEWSFVIDRDVRHRYWQFMFWQGYVSLVDIRYSGEAFYPDTRVTAPVPMAKPFIRGIFDDDVSEDDFIMLATIEVKNNQVVSIRDTRKSSRYKYEPVAEWLTDFHDRTLKCLFDDVLNYSHKFLSPISAGYQFYLQMEDNECTGLGEIALDGEASEMKLPLLVELYDDVFDATRVASPQLVYVGSPEDAGDLVTMEYVTSKLESFYNLDNGKY